MSVDITQGAPEPLKVMLGSTTLNLVLGRWRPGDIGRYPSGTLMAIEKTAFWSDPNPRSFSNDFPRVTPELVADAEKQLGVNLPREYIELLQIQNGGYTNDFAIPTPEPTTWASNWLPVEQTLRNWPQCG